MVLMKSLKALKQNNKGAGIVTVIVILSFLTTLGLLIMAISYTSSEMKSSERTGREVAYNAAGVVEQMRSGAELAVSDSIKNCYTKVMTNYSLYRDEIEVSFDRYFNSALNDWKPYFVDGDGKTRYYTETGSSLDKTQGIDFLCGDVETYYTEGTNVYQVYKGYNIKALEKFVKAGFGGDAVVSCIPLNEADENVGVAQWTYDIKDGVKTPKSVTLKDIQVSYKRLLRTVRITTDIVIDFPDLGYVFNEKTQGSKFTEFAVIALQALNQQTGYVDVEGKAYAGKVDISGASEQHRFRLKPGGLLITPGDISVRGNNKNYENQSEVNAALAAIEDEDQRAAERLKVESGLVIDNGSTLWANGINLTQNGIASFCYRANVKNDLNLSASGSAALITGDYFYGFGDSETNPDESSSILVQGFNTSTTDEKNNPVLNIYDLNNLTLAGYAFVNDGTTTGGVKTGQSMAATEDQTAYLMPMEMLDYEDFAIKISTNPEVFSPDLDNSRTSAQVYEAYCAQLAAKLTEDNRPNSPRQKTLWTIGGIEKKPADYGITIKPVSVNYAGYTIGYFFMEFDTVEHANQYFRDYFQANTSRVQNYLSQYLSLTDTASYAGTVGNTFTFNKLTEKFLLRNINSVINIASIRSAVEKKLAAFHNLCVTLNEGFGAENALEDELGTDEEKEARAGATNPFEYYVREEVVNSALDKAAQLSGDNVNTTIFFNDDHGNPVAVVTRNPDFTYTSSMSTVCLIIALGDVSIQSDFTGLIICKGSVDVEVASGSTVTLTADSDAVTAAMGTVSTYSREQLGFEPLEDIDTDGVMPFEFLYYKYVPATSTDISDVGSYWDVGTLVHFDKWKKN